MDEVIKKRTLKVNGMRCAECENLINESLSAMEGVRNVKADKNGTVYVEYNLMEIRLEDIVKKIYKLGYKPSKTISERIRRSFIIFKEENEFNNITIPLHGCCSVDEVEKIIDKKKPHHPNTD